MIIGSRVAIRINWSDMWKCKQGLQVWKTIALSQHLRAVSWWCLKNVIVSTNGKRNLCWTLNMKWFPPPPWKGANKLFPSSSTLGKPPPIRPWGAQNAYKISGQRAQVNKLKTLCDHPKGSQARKGAWETKYGTLEKGYRWDSHRTLVMLVKLKTSSLM